MAIDLRDVPKEKQNFDMCLTSVSADGCQLEFVNPALQTEELCLAAVKQGGTALEYVQNQTPELCLEAVKQSGWALQYVKEQTPEICLAAIKQAGWALEHVKDKSPEICLEAVKRDGYALKYIPLSKQTLSIALAALKQEPKSWKYLADRFRKPEVYEAAGWYDYEPDDLAPAYRNVKQERTEERH